MELVSRFSTVWEGCSTKKRPEQTRPEPSSEVESQHELQNASAGFDRTRDVPVGAANLPERRPDIVVVGAARAGAEVRHVKNVERRGAELDVDLLVDGDPRYDAGIEE